MKLEFLNTEGHWAPIDPLVGIDGPAGVGKSTAARSLAVALGGECLNSGAIYRGIALLLDGCDPSDEVGVMDAVHKMPLSLTPDGTLMLSEQPVIGDLFSAENTALVARVARVAGVRETVTALVRAWIVGHANRLIVLEGRDACTTLLSGHRAARFYIDAPLDVRGQRRAGDNHSTPETEAERLKERDTLDQGLDRTTPTTPGVVVIDASGTPADTLRRLLERVRVG
ncbi:MAG: (d)CMP kinase [Phycisphaerales bacterium]|nr:(d)CMP kinase [Phycisphaerales bacterium]